MKLSPFAVGVVTALVLTSLTGCGTDEAAYQVEQRNPGITVECVSEETWSDPEVYSCTGTKIEGGNKVCYKVTVFDDDYKKATVQEADFDFCD